MGKAPDGFAITYDCLDLARSLPVWGCDHPRSECVSVTRELMSHRMHDTPLPRFLLPNVLLRGSEPPEVGAEHVDCEIPRVPRTRVHNLVARAIDTHRS